jgi:sugar/nucleoside kinase (ribokinase family)
MIICIGSINVDFIFATSRWPTEHEKYRAENYVCANGGAAANTARELSRLGRKVMIVGGIGNDDLGNIALNGLIAAGVNIDHVIRRNDWKTECAAIRSMGKSKSILTAGVVDVAVVFDSLKTLSFQQGDHLHFSWVPSHEIRDRLRHWRHIGVSLSWETDGQMDMPTAKLFDIIFMNEVELKIYEDKGLVTDAWIKSLEPDLTVVVTLGDVGAEAYFKGQRFFCKAHQVNIVDRTGDGDAFDAGFLDAWLGRWALNACLKRGLRSAAINLGRFRKSRSGAADW